MFILPSLVRFPLSTTQLLLNSARPFYVSLPILFFFFKLATLKQVRHGFLIDVAWQKYQPSFTRKNASGNAQTKIFWISYWPFSWVSARWQCQCNSFDSSTKILTCYFSSACLHSLTELNIAFPFLSVQLYIEVIPLLLLLQVFHMSWLQPVKN